MYINFSNDLCLKLFWDWLLGLLFICLTNLQVIIFLNFKEKNLKAILVNLKTYQ